MHPSSSDDTDSGASSSDSDDADSLTTVLRKERMQKINRKRAMKNRKGCDSDSSSSESEEDVIQVKLDLKRGDDVVKALLDLGLLRLKELAKQMESSGPEAPSIFLDILRSGRLMFGLEEDVVCGMVLKHNIGWQFGLICSLFKTSKSLSRKQ
ncbi:hypothetical protein WAI453_009177 [Rhynchosporium graminicola]